MNRRKITHNTLKNQKGVVLIVVLGFVLLMSITTMFFIDIMKQDMELIARAKGMEQARNLAEAGINHALAEIRANGVSGTTVVTDSLDTGSYVVTYSQVGPRALLTSVGTVGPISRTVAAEISGTIDSPLTKMYTASNSLKLRATGSSSLVEVTGDIHSNNDVELKSLNNGVIRLIGEVSAVGIVLEGAQHDAPDAADDFIFINGVNNDAATVEEGAPFVYLEPVDWITNGRLSDWKQKAIDAGDYYSSNQTFTGSISPSSGYAYVDGNVTISGACTLNGSLIADDIKIDGNLSQIIKSDVDFINIIYAKAADGDITVHGSLETEGAIVHARRDVTTGSAGAGVDVKGCIIVGRDITFWNITTVVKYEYRDPDDYAPGLKEEEVRIISWNPPKLN